MSEPSISTDYRHWRLETDLDGIQWLYLDRAGKARNTLGREVLEELERVIEGVEQERPRGLVLMSGKPGHFALGADVQEFEQVDTEEAAPEYLKRVHRLFDRIEQLDLPTAVAIEGFCLGGGLELALCFNYRIARNVDATRIGFPEVRLGIYPGFGGSARSTQVMGGQKAMEIMLTGRMLRAGQARAAGLLDTLSDAHGSLRWAARQAVLKGRRSSGPGLLARLTSTKPARHLLARIMRKQTARQARPQHYPAPYQLIDAWEAHGNDKRAMLDAEIEHVPALLMSDTSAGLRRVFRLMERLKERGRGGDFRARRVHVVGAGVMGGDIAAWCALKELDVTLQDREMKYIEPALKRAHKLFRRKLKQPAKAKAAMDRLRADVEGVGAGHADVVIEAIFEDLEAKQALYRELEPRMPAHAVLATNTSALPLDQLAEALQRPERLIGLHFFNPVAKMPLVEVVHDPKRTDGAEVDKGTRLVGQIGKYPLPVKSSPGFLVNRVLAPYMTKAMELNRDGVPKEALDKAAERFGMPMGPVELADTVGLDVGMSVIKTLGGEGADEQIQALKAMVDAGKLGKKSGQGFYTWKKGKPVRGKDEAQGHDLDQLAEQLLKPYLDECRACLNDGIVADADLLDAGLIFGTGFAPFRGGPMHYLGETS